MDQVDVGALARASGGQVEDLPRWKVEDGSGLVRVLVSPFRRFAAPSFGSWFGSGLGVGVGSSVRAEIHIKVSVFEGLCVKHIQLLPLPRMGTICGDRGGSQEAHATCT